MGGCILIQVKYGPGAYTTAHLGGHNHPCNRVFTSVASPLISFVLFCFVFIGASLGKHQESGSARKDVQN